VDKKWLPSGELDRQSTNNYILWHAMGDNVSPQRLAGMDDTQQTANPLSGGKLQLRKAAKLSAALPLAAFQHVSEAKKRGATFGSA
jgi:hypothetical protein